MSKKIPVGLADAVERHLSKYFNAHGNHLPAHGLYDRALAEFERPLLALTLKATNNNQLHAARLLGINRNTLRRKLTMLGLLSVTPKAATRRKVGRRS